MTARPTPDPVLLAAIGAAVRAAMPEIAAQVLREIQARQVAAVEAQLRAAIPEILQQVQAWLATPSTGTRAPIAGPSPETMAKWQRDHETYKRIRAMADASRARRAEREGGAT